MTLKKPDIVILDMDGTTVRHIHPRLLHVLEFFDNLGYRISKLFSWLFKQRAKGPIIPVWHKKQKRPRLLVHRAIHKFRRKPVEQIVEPCPGIYALLELFKEHNIPMALVSNGLGKGYGYDVLKKFELDKYFPVAIFREDISQSKPDPEPLIAAIDNLDLDRELKEENTVWYIGDRRKDILAALAADEHYPCTITPIAFGFNAALAAMEKNIGSDHIFMSFHDMYDLLKPMLEKEGKSSTVEDINISPATDADSTYNEINDIKENARIKTLK